MDIVLLFPGQGSQKPGMGKDLAAAFPEAKSAFEAADDALGSPLSRTCFEGPADELTQTRNAQPALFTHGAAVWSVVQNRLAAHVVAAAGHSLGEFTAYHAAGSMSPANGVRLVRRRGELMYETGTSRPGTMAAILGTTSTPIAAICQQATQGDSLVVPANYNSDEQTVISGEIDAVERAMALAKEAGAKRAIRLPVSGAFHSPLMAPAKKGLQEAISAAALSNPAFPVYSNVTAEASTNSASAEKLLLEQLTSPVSWATEVRNIASRFPDALYVELGPGSVLSGLMGRLVKGARSIAVGGPAEVEQLLKMVS